MVDILIEIATNERFHVWNIHQHLPQKSPSYLGKYSIHGASGIWFMLVRENKTSKDCRTRRLSAFYPHKTTITWPSHARLNLHSHMSHSPQQLRMGPQWYIIPLITGLLGHDCQQNSLCSLPASTAGDFVGKGRGPCRVFVRYIMYMACICFIHILYGGFRKWWYKVGPPR